LGNLADAPELANGCKIERQQLFFSVRLACSMKNRPWCL